MYFLQIVINVTVETFFITAYAYAQQCIGQYYTVGLQYVGYSSLSLNITGGPAFHIMS